MVHKIQLVNEDFNFALFLAKLSNIFLPKAVRWQLFPWSKKFGEIDPKCLLGGLCNPSNLLALWILKVSNAGH